jgi:uncharacterized membrane protein YeaQ/YmgE (transglycosylase-associated protein family)
MELLPWVFLALGAGLIARAIVPKTERATTWVEVMLIGTAGTIFSAVLRQQVFDRAGNPDGWALLFAIAGSVIFAFLHRMAIRRMRKREHPVSAATRRRAA